MTALGPPEGIFFFGIHLFHKDHDMPTMHCPLGPIASLALLLIASLLLTACNDGEAESGMNEAEIRDEFTQDVWRTAEYTVRGEVVSLPTANDDLMVRHEAIPEYRSTRGMGMDVMVMPFPLGAGISLDGVEPGDKLSITFSVDYEEGWSPISYRVIGFEELPSDTELDFTPLPREDN